MNQQLPYFSRIERLIVELLAKHRELSGLQMIDLSDGQLKLGTAYVMLGRMEEKGYLYISGDSPRHHKAGVGHRFYRLTDVATRALSAYRQAEQQFSIDREAC